MSKGRLAASGDFHEIRALMDDRPLRLRVRTDAARALGGALLGAGVVVGVRLEDDGSLLVDTQDARRLGARAAPSSPGRESARLLEVRAARQRPRRRLPLPRRAMTATRSHATATARDARDAPAALHDRAPHAADAAPAARRRLARRDRAPPRRADGARRRPAQRDRRDRRAATGSPSPSRSASSGSRPRASAISSTTACSSTSG